MNSSNLANAPSPTRFKHIPDPHKVLIVFIDTRHGTGKPEKVVPWLLISDEQHEQLGGLSMDTLAQWRRATTGQAGVLRLDWQNSGTESFTFEMRTCGFCAPAIPTICHLTRSPALVQTVIPSVEYTRLGNLKLCVAPAVSTPGAHCSVSQAQTATRAATPQRQQIWTSVLMASCRVSTRPAGPHRNGGVSQLISKLPYANACSNAITGSASSRARREGRGGPLCEEDSPVLGIFLAVLSS
jgi:hypothetical protein